MRKIITEKEIDGLITPIVNIFSQLEVELILEIVKRLDNYDGIKGSLEWYYDKLKEMGQLNENVLKRISNLSGKDITELKKALETAQKGSFDEKELLKAFDEGTIKVNPKDLVKNPVFKNLLENSFIDSQENIRLIKTKATEGSRAAYMDVLNKAYVEVGSGIYSYEQSINRAVKNLAQKGIGVVTYPSGRSVSMEAAVRRDVLSAVNKLQNETAMKEVEAVGAEYVETSQHLGARVSDKSPQANHSGWQGKVFKLNGSDDKYENFYEATGYGTIEGLAGVNCRHRFFPFFPGISIPSNPVDEEKNEKEYKDTQKQRKLERDLRSLKKEKEVQKELGNGEIVKELNKKIREKQQELDQWCRDHGLERDYARERIEYKNDKPYVDVTEIWKKYAKGSNDNSDIEIADRTVTSNGEVFDDSNAQFNPIEQADFEIGTIFKRKYWGKTELQRAIKFPYNKRSADLALHDCPLLAEQKIDIKSPNGKPTQRHLRKRIKSAKGQCSNVLLNLTDYDIPYEEAIHAIEVIYETGDWLDLIIVWKDNNMVQAFKKKGS